MTARRTLPNGRSGDQKTDRFAHNAPPTDQGWVWFTREMLESRAWAAMSLAGRKVLDRLIIEHMNHAGTMNGELVVTYADFAKFGIRRPSIAGAIEEAIALGWVDRTVQGGRNYGSGKRPSKYGLTWVGRRDRTPPSNRWRQAVLPVDIYRRYENVPWGNGGNPSPKARERALQSNENVPCTRHENVPGEINSRVRR